MPQVSHQYLPKLEKFLSSKGISVRHYIADPKEYEATQSEFNIEKVNSIIDGGIEKIINTEVVVSKDRRIIDGHHRWLALKKTETKMKVFEINKDYEDVLDLLNEFPKTFGRGINEHKEFDNE